MILGISNSGTIIVDYFTDEFLEVDTYYNYNGVERYECVCKVDDDEDYEY